MLSRHDRGTASSHYGRTARERAKRADERVLSGLTRSEHAQAMSVGIERDERVSEVELDRRLRDRQAASSPLAMLGTHRFGVADRERELTATESRRRSRLDRVFRPQPEHHAATERKQ